MVTENFLVNIYGEPETALITSGTHEQAAAIYGEQYEIEVKALVRVIPMSGGEEKLLVVFEEMTPQWFAREPYPDELPLE